MNKRQRKKKKNKQLHNRYFEVDVNLLQSSAEQKNNFLEQLFKCTDEHELTCDGFWQSETVKFYFSSNSIHKILNEQDKLFIIKFMREIDILDSFSISQFFY